MHLDLLPDAGHYELIVPTVPAWPAVRHAVLTLLGRASCVVPAKAGNHDEDGIPPRSSPG
ncbi:MAG: hypothetical protein HY892_10810 [Deltaproteobacteria bacterium]|nr:hypothetical protein [Deltaproteobacteria bacterium]